MENFPSPWSLKNVRVVADPENAYGPVIRFWEHNEQMTQGLR